MNNTFNIKRFGRLLIKQLTEHYKTYLMGVAVLTGVMLVGGSFFLFLTPAVLDLSAQVVLFGSIYFLAGTIFTSTVFADLSDKKKSISYLTLPASHFEKFFTGWLISMVLFSLVYLVSFYSILMILLHVKHWPGQRTEVLNVFVDPMPVVFIVYAMLHGFSIWGAIFFERLHFIKTAFCFFIGIIALSVVNTSFIEMLLGREVRTATPFGGISFIEGHKYVAVASVRQTDPLVGYVFIAIAIVFWTAAYCRLKEKQV
ncbi:MAG: hypothetical protein V4577_08635 [Bacteroidota bacterium]